MKLRIFALCILIHYTLPAQEVNYNEKEISINKYIDGTLLNANNNITKKYLAIIIAGSGPTDRNGNQHFLVNNSLKKLAEALTNNGISTFSYDKRIVKQIKNGTVDKNIMYDDFVTDAKSVIAYFKSIKAYDKIFVIGHSQGSLTGMIACSEISVDGFISISGAGQTIDNVILDQIEKTAPIFTEESKQIIEKLRNGEKTTQYPEALSSIFKIDIQPFIMNWMQYDPKVEIKKLQVPILILNGTKDLQVLENEAKLLTEAVPEATLKIVDGMNHIMFLIEGDDLENSKSYNESFRPISSELTDSITDFISSN